MASCAEVVARTLAEAGITRMFGLPGGEILDFIEAARQAGIEFILTRHEAAASFMADVTGQIERRPGVCVSTLGPGAVNMALGVANAYLDRSPVLAITAAIARSVAPYATHQNLDLNAIYRPFTKAAITLDGEDTAAKVRQACRLCLEPRMGPVHLAIPSDVAKLDDRHRAAESSLGPDLVPAKAPSPAAIDRFAAEIRRARRPVLVLGIDLDPSTDAAMVLAFVEHLGVPVVVTPKAKGILPEDHPLFVGVCAGVAADGAMLDLLAQSDLLVGIGYDPVESDKLWHQTMKLVSLAPVSIAAGMYRPRFEVIGRVSDALAALLQMSFGPFEWSDADRSAHRERLLHALQPRERPASGLSPYEVTRRLRALYPRDTLHATDVGSIKFIVSQAWKTYEAGTFFVSNGLSSMSYGLPAAMAAKLAHPERLVLCTIGDGGFGMTMAEIETCVRRRIHFVTVVFNDSALSLIRVVQSSRGYPDYGVGFGPVDVARIARGLGAWARRVGSLDELDRAVVEAQRLDRPAVIEVPIDPAEYRGHNAPARTTRQV